MIFKNTFELVSYELEKHSFIWCHMKNVVAQINFMKKISVTGIKKKTLVTIPFFVNLV